ncbi:MAG: GNAT family N-acetyltransferase [Alphaproteobacteria bacterium]|nr:GNAT family N-acetyltransferase [Alphaproteobacteria bacterium]
MLGPLFSRDAGIELASHNLVLRQPRATDFKDWRAVRMASRAFLTPFEPTWADNELTHGSYRARVRRYARDAAEQCGYTFFVFLGDDRDELAGGVTLSNIRRRVAQTCSLGYWMSARHAGQGIMTEAVGRLLPFVFSDMGLHRIEAACLPHNQASIRVLQKSRFVKEGLAKGYLMIDGKWQDHLLFALNQESHEHGQNQTRNQDRNQGSPSGSGQGAPVG